MKRQILGVAVTAALCLGQSARASGEAQPATTVLPAGSADPVGPRLLWQIGESDNDFQDLIPPAGYVARTMPFLAEVILQPGTDSPAGVWPAVQPALLDDWAARCKLSPERRWKVFVQGSVHADIGFTDLQENVKAVHNQMTVRALETCQAYPEFKWNTEIAWVVDNFIHQMPPPQVELLRPRRAHPETGFADGSSVAFYRTGGVFGSQGGPLFISRTTDQGRTSSPPQPVRPCRVNPLGRTAARGHRPGVHRFQEMKAFAPVSKTTGATALQLNASDASVIKEV